MFSVRLLRQFGHICERNLFKNENKKKPGIELTQLRTAGGLPCKTNEPPSERPTTEPLFLGGELRSGGILKETASYTLQRTCVPEKTKT